MKTAAALVLLVSLAAAVQEGKEEERYAFAYKGEKGTEKIEIDSKFTLAMDGNEITIDFFRSASPFLSFGEIRLRAEGVRRVQREAGADREGRIRIRYDEGRVDGTYDDEPYEYDFSRAAPPADTQEDKLKGMLWLVFWAGKTYGLTPDGAATFEDPNQDASGEVMDLFGQGIIRFPERKLGAGDEWELSYRTESVQKDNRGWFELKQKSKIGKIEDGKAHITTTIEGEIALPEDAVRDPNVKKAEHTVSGTIETVFDVAKGAVVSSTSAGKVRAYTLATDPNGGDDHEIEILLGVESSIRPRE